MRKSILFTLCCLSALAALPAAAQVGISAGLSFPGKDMRDNGTGYYSELRIGSVVGIQYNYGLTERVDLLAGFDFTDHILGQMAMRRMGDNYKLYPSYMTFSMMVGGAYKIDFDGQGFINPAHHAFVELRSGLNFSTHSHAVLESDGGRSTVKYKGSWSPGFSVGVGMKFSPRSSIALRYSDFGDAVVRCEDTGVVSRYSPRTVELRYTFWL